MLSPVCCRIAASAAALEAYAKHALNAFDATAKIYLAELQAQLENARFRFDKGLESAKLELEKVRFEYDAEFKAIELEMARIKGVGELSLNAAQVHGQLASSALSSLNSVVSAAVSSEV